MTYRIRTGKVVSSALSEGAEKLSSSGSQGLTGTISRAGVPLETRMEKIPVGKTLSEELLEINLRLMGMSPETEKTTDDDTTDAKVA